MKEKTFVRLPDTNSTISCSPFAILSPCKLNTGVHQVRACGKNKASSGITMPGTPAIAHFAKVFAMQTRIVGLWNAATVLATAPGGKVVPASRRGGIRQK